MLLQGPRAPGCTPCLAERGFFPKEDLKTLRHIGSHLQGHPNMNDTPGVDMSTGSLGQGISAAVGMAVAAKHWGDTYRTYALLGDGESEEGQVWEAAMFAGNQQLDNLCVIVDHNGLQIDGPVEEVNDPMPLADKFRAFKFHVVELADGNRFRPDPRRLCRGSRYQGSADRHYRRDHEGQGRLLYGEPGGLAR